MQASKQIKKPCLFRFFHIFSCTNVVRVLSFYYICSEIIDRFEHFVNEKTRHNMKQIFAIASLIALIGAAISTTSCSSDDDKDSGEWITPNNADVTVLYYSNGGGDLDAVTEWDLVGAAYELCTDTRNVRLFVQHKYTGQKAYGQYIADERKKNPAFTQKPGFFMRGTGYIKNIPAKLPKTRQTFATRLARKKTVKNGKKSSR